MNSPALSHASWLALALSTSLAACSANNGDPGTGAGAAGGGNSPGAGGLLGGGGTTGGGGVLPGSGGSGLGSLPGNGGAGNGSGGKAGECPSVSQETEKVLGGKADIIWAIDTSGSMIEELAAVQNNMNAFSSFIIGTGIDVHVIAVAVAVKDFFGIPTPGLCIAPPLGSGGSCFNAGDSNPPRYTHVDWMVNSHDALGVWISTYPQWQGAIRSDSTKTFVIVSDDEAEDVLAPEFTQFFNNAWPGSTWRFSGIFCMSEPENGNCAGIGNNYDQLVKQTGGVWADLADPNPDWNAVFKQLGDAVVADAKPVDCAWKIPPPPTGMVFDKNKVNVEFTPTSGVKETFFYVKDVATCKDGSSWYYDNEANPTTVLACPQACTKIQADQNAKINVAFGCERKSRVE